MKLRSGMAPILVVSLIGRHQNGAFGAAQELRDVVISACEPIAYIRHHNDDVSLFHGYLCLIQYPLADRVLIAPEDAAGVGHDRRGRREQRRPGR